MAALSTVTNDFAN